jgi:hypothetical protein
MSEEVEKVGRPQWAGWIGMLQRVGLRLACRNELDILECRRGSDADGISRRLEQTEGRCDGHIGSDGMSRARQGHETKET